MKKYEELKKMKKEDLQFYISFNISPFINVKRKKDELIRLICALGYCEKLKEEKENENN